MGNDVCVGHPVVDTVVSGKNIPSPGMPNERQALTSASLEDTALLDRNLALIQSAMFAHGIGQPTYSELLSRASYTRLV